MKTTIRKNSVNDSYQYDNIIITMAISQALWSRWFPMVGISQEKRVWELLTSPGHRLSLTQPLDGVSRLFHHWQNWIPPWPSTGKSHICLIYLVFFPCCPVRVYWNYCNQSISNYQVRRSDQEFLFEGGRWRSRSTSNIPKGYGAGGWYALSA